ncbi:MAG: hypothetical protein ACNI3A_01375 [Desulfovibrio sp.]|uniref:hypothetical protein n=1 Tax=Desulfovibrio sp. 7SRBS1 TaxID=3378064 RepID=UPI003B3FC06C
MNCMRTLLTLVCFLFLLTALHAADERYTATGMSFFEPGREVVAREKALFEAKRALLEKAIGTQITSSTEVRDFMTVRDQIMSRSSGYLKNVKILKEEKNDYGAIEITIEAGVEIPKLLDDSKKLTRLVSMQRNPKVAVRISPNVKPNDRIAAEKAAGRITAKLQNSGFTVIKVAESEGTPSLLLDVGIEAQSSSSTFQDITLSVNEVSLTTSIHRPDDGKVLATAANVQTVPGDNRLMALDKGSVKCVDAVWRDLSAKLTQAWENEIFGQRGITLRIASLPDHASAKKVAEILKADVPGVAAASLIKYNKGKGTYSVSYKGWPDFFINEITMSYFQDKYFRCKVTKTSGDTINLKYLK